MVRQTTFTELRSHAKDYFDAVEAGEIVRVYRNGRPIADIVPIAGAESSWRQPVARLVLPGVRLSRVVIDDRAESEGGEREGPTASVGSGE
jgi:prevent-host-death family protein